MTSVNDKFEVIIIGGGPAGLSAALWCVDLGLDSIVIEKESELGGQLLWTYNKIKNYLGCEAENGHELAARFIRHIENAKVNYITGCEVVAADLANKTVKLADGHTFFGKAIVIATGVRRKKLGVSGECDFVGRGILESGVKSKDQVAGKTVVIVGGGDAALENSLILSDMAARVVVIHRREQFSARHDFVERALLKPNIEFILNSVITAIKGDASLQGVEIANSTSQNHSYIAADALLIRIGIMPRNEMFSQQIELDSNGYFLVDKNFETSSSDVFAIGDVADPRSLTINSAVGSGVIVAKVISQRREKKTKI
jgi:thioredoxin reductase (NADPH)